MEYCIKILLVLTGLYSICPEACRYRAQSIEERYDSADYVYTAWVTGVQLIEFDIHRENEMKKEPEELFQVVGYELKQFSLLSVEKHKGKGKFPKEVDGGRCGDGYVDLRDKAIFFVSRDEGGDYTSFAISESNDKKYFLKSLKKVIELSN